MRTNHEDSVAMIGLNFDDGFLREKELTVRVEDHGDNEQVEAVQKFQLFPYELNAVTGELEQGPEPFIDFDANIIGELESVGLDKTFYRNPEKIAKDDKFTMDMMRKKSRATYNNDSS